jgi:hypothetical protein
MYSKDEIALVHVAPDVGAVLVCLEVELEDGGLRSSFESFVCFRRRTHITGVPPSGQPTIVSSSLSQ